MVSFNGYSFCHFGSSQKNGGPKIYNLFACLDVFRELFSGITWYWNAAMTSSETKSGISCNLVTGIEASGFIVMGNWQRGESCRQFPSRRRHVSLVPIMLHYNVAYRREELGQSRSRYRWQRGGRHREAGDSDGRAYDARRGRGNKCFQSIRFKP